MSTLVERVECPAMEVDVRFRHGLSLFRVAESCGIAYPTAAPRDGQLYTQRLTECIQHPLPRVWERRKALPGVEGEPRFRPGSAPGEHFRSSGELEVASRVG